jgi:hypothetical protein
MFLATSAHREEVVRDLPCAQVEFHEFTLRGFKEAMQPAGTPA